jgi:hypothetical protein
MHSDSNNNYQRQRWLCLVLYDFVYDRQHFLCDHGYLFETVAILRHECISRSSQRVGVFQLVGLSFSFVVCVDAYPKWFSGLFFR